MKWLTIRNPVDRKVRPAVRLREGAYLRGFSQQLVREVFVWVQLSHPHILKFLGVADLFPLYDSGGVTLPYMIPERQSGHLVPTIGPCSDRRGRQPK